MLDGKWKHLQDPYWDRLGRRVAALGVSANQITLAGTIAMALWCAAYPWHRQSALFALGIACIELSDDLDGAVARVTGSASAFGAYLDAVSDRYKELFVYVSLAVAHGCWPLSFACLSGSLLTSYNKARAGMERPVSNVAWPDLFERFERIVALCAGLLLSAIFPRIELLSLSAIELTLAVLAVLSHASAFQRFLRARRLLTSPS